MCVCFGVGGGGEEVDIVIFDTNMGDAMVDWEAQRERRQTPLCRHLTSLQVADHGHEAAEVGQV